MTRLSARLNEAPQTKENKIINSDVEGNDGWDRPITREGLVTVLHSFAQCLDK